MRDLRDIIRPKFSAQAATREIARRLGMAPSTVRETLKRLASAGLSRLRGRPTSSGHDSSDSRFGANLSC